MDIFEELWKVVRAIPYGRASTYGDVGRAMKNPASGYMVGRWMTRCPPDVPWWRVVAKGGIIALSKRSPKLGMDQQSRLTEEGIKFEDGRVSPTALISYVELLSLKETD